MPELPEVETTLRGILPHLIGHSVIAVTVRTAKLRLPLTADLADNLVGHRIQAVTRRGKYLLLSFDSDTLLIHLGMTGHLHLAAPGTPPGKHDHFELTLDNNSLLRLHDPRKFGIVLRLTGDPHLHPLLSGLGPEPLEDDFSAAYLDKISRNRRVAVKQLLMNSRLVVGVGNIYANEALFRAGIAPSRAAGKLTASDCERLVASVRTVLEEAIVLGGTTLQDYFNSEGKPGYFRLELKVYGREGKNCLDCGALLHQSRLGGRATCWCPGCQPEDGNLNS